MLPVSSEILNELRQLSGKRLAILEERYWHAHLEGLKPKGSNRDRSRADFRLLCWLIDCRVDAETCWYVCRDVGKFSAHGRRYFDTTLANVLKREM